MRGLLCVLRMRGYYFGIGLLYRTGESTGADYTPVLENINCFMTQGNQISKLFREAKSILTANHG
jgi:hypothetical protein